MYASSLLVQALLATAAFAVPTQPPRIARRLGARRLGRETLAAESTTTTGPVINASPGTWKTVIGTFTVPAASQLTSATSASAWVGIDGDTCTSAILQVGVDFTVSGSSVTYDGWYEWYPDYAYSVSGIGFSAGDSVTLNVTATSKTAGVATITNASKGVSVSKKITSTAALCEQDAEWQVEVFSSGGVVVPSPPVVFTKEEAITNNGTIIIPSGSA
ncbi:hypothetical protein PHLGIDRAFT_131247 [Phlebiopsis gigantea 11061_1 CR5-6]|uniref:Uncharacterized protein n=1 Tax=Phlebiopsis gigantea (strain 11061_1 CR5-6) TaxID=745531 RepID=A0A0C3P9T4_PHLG1|nr:hypothetical protein PHLGIDRAFT_131247 [Phlebiopsis gigantea 11061_1 CR5-6]